MMTVNPVTKNNSVEKDGLGFDPTIGAWFKKYRESYEWPYRIGREKSEQRISLLLSPISSSINNRQIKEFSSALVRIHEWKTYNKDNISQKYEEVLKAKNPDYLAEIFNLHPFDNTEKVSVLIRKLKIPNCNLPVCSAMASFIYNRREVPIIDRYVAQFFARKFNVDNGDEETRRVLQYLKKIPFQLEDLGNGYIRLKVYSGNGFEENLALYANDFIRECQRVSQDLNRNNFIYSDPYGKQLAYNPVDVEMAIFSYATKNKMVFQYLSKPIELKSTQVIVGEKVPSGLSYQPSSPVLIIIIDAFLKDDRNESDTYRKEFSIFNQNLDESNIQYLIQSRQKIFNLLKTGGLKWQWSDHKDSVFNQNLRKGEDLGFNPPGRGLKYLPAIERFSSDLYANLGEDGKEKLLSKKHHVLILAGLYGFLCPLEPVQMYDCILDENNENYQIWKKDNGLTKVLLDYIRKNGIKRVFEFTSVHDYRNVIDWSFLKETHKDLEIFHCYYKHADGEKGLSPLGKFLKETFLEMPLERILGIQDGFEIQHILFSASACRTDKTIKRPLPQGWKKLAIELVTDTEVRSHFETAETLTQTLYRSPKVPPDAGSTIMIEYAKGLERMLNNEVARQFRAHAFAHYTSKSFKMDKLNYFDLPKDLKDLLNENEEHVKAINPRGWEFLRKGLNEYPKVNSPGVGKFLDEILGLLGRKYGTDFDKIEKVCAFFSQYRDKAAHDDVLSLEDLLNIRNEIIENLNTLLVLFYEKYKVDLRILIKDLQSQDIYKRLDAILALGGTGEEMAVAPLLKCLSDTNVLIRGCATESLGHLNKRNAAIDLHRYLTRERDRDVLNRMRRVYTQLASKGS